jgi:hypothetical protein
MVTRGENLHLAHSAVNVFLEASCDTLNAGNLIEIVARRRQMKSTRAIGYRVRWYVASGTVVDSRNRSLSSMDRERRIPGISLDFTVASLSVRLMNHVSGLWVPTNF